MEYKHCKVMRLKDGKKLLQVYANENKTDYRFTYLLTKGTGEKANDQYEYIRLVKKHSCSDTYSPYPDHKLYSKQADSLYKKSRLQMLFK